MLVAKFNHKIEVHQVSGQNYEVNSPMSEYGGMVFEQFGHDQNRAAAMMWARNEVDKIDDWKEHERAMNS